MTDDLVTGLVEFIRARLDEAEAHARKDLWLIERATPLDQWTVAYGYNLPYSLLGEDGSIGRITSSRGQPLADGERDLHQADAMLVGRLVRRAARDAASVLRDVEAKRRILTEVYAKAQAHEYGGGWDDAEMAMWDVLRLLALPYADHPDYRKEWTP